MSIVQLPVKEFGGKKWIMLNQIDSKFMFRAESISKPQRSPDPSDHRATQVIGEGSPKCTPKRYDISEFK